MEIRSDIVVKDITLYAKWQQVDYTVTFNVNGGNAIDPQGVAEGRICSKTTHPNKRKEPLLKDGIRMLL